jgi:hypothetical protein
MFKIWNYELKFVIINENKLGIMNLMRAFIKHYLSFLLVVFLFVGCKHGKSKTANTNDSKVTISNHKDYINVVTTAMDFDLPKEIQSGWTTFRYINNSTDTHFFIFEKMPEGITIDNYRNEIVPPFKAAFTFLLDGNNNAAMEEFKKIPQWWSKVELGGGVGLISPNSKAESTIYMNPGRYVMECYVRLPSGMPHTFFGMLKEVVVTKEKNDHKRPSPNLEISLNSEKGVSFVDSLKAGNYELAVNFEDQKQYGSFLGHDVNLVKLDNISLLDTLNNWVNTSDIKAFRSPAPKGLTFLGGVEDLKAGETGYFNVSLDDGMYVLISEIPNAVEKKMFKLFKVY